jgi:hypothetical protein
VKKTLMGITLFFNLSVSAKENGPRVSLCRHFAQVAPNQGKLISIEDFHEQIKKSGRVLIARQSFVERLSLQGELLLSATLNFKNQKSKLRCAESMIPGARMFFQAPALIQFDRGVDSRDSQVKYWQFQVSGSESGIEIWNSPLRSKMMIEDWIKTNLAEKIRLSYEITHPDEAVLIIEKTQPQGRETLRITYDVVSSKFFE